MLKVSESLSPFDAAWLAAEGRHATPTERAEWVWEHLYASFDQLDFECVPDRKALVWLRALHGDDAAKAKFLAEYATRGARDETKADDPFQDDGREVFDAIDAYRRTSPLVAHRCKFGSCDGWFEPEFKYCPMCGRDAMGKRAPWRGRPQGPPDD